MFGYRITSAHLLRSLPSALFILLLASFPAKAENYQELLLFPSLHAEYIDTSPKNTENDHEDVHVEATVDLFFALSYENTRFLTEALAGTHELELERAQLGWEYQLGHRLWVGRFHTPLGYWNPKYNHSTFLQTSLHRPDIVNFEDHGGVLPMHVAGAMTEGETSIGNGKLEYNFIYGAGAQLAEGELTSTRLIDIREKGLGLNLFGAVTYQPDEFSQSQLGIYGAYSEIKPEGDLQTSVDQIIVGGFFHRIWLKARIVGSAFYVDNTVKAATHESDYFIAGYLHGEYEITPQLVNYVRYEDSINTQDNTYINILSPLPQRKGVLGLRYDINNSHALGLELSVSEISDFRLIHSSIQWSAVFP